MGIVKEINIGNPLHQKVKITIFSLNSYVRWFVGLSYIPKMAKTTFAGGEKFFNWKTGKNLKEDLKKGREKGGK